MTTADQITETDVITYSGPDLARLAGATYREIDYWTRLGLLPETARGSGTQRVFSAADLDTVRLVVYLRRFGLELRRSFEVARIVVDADRYSVVLADVFELTISVRDTTGTQP